MKVMLDLDQLLKDQKITQLEYEKLSALAAKSTNYLAFGILIGFGVIAVGGATLVLLPTTTAIVIGLLVFISGLGLLRSGFDHWKLLAHICIMTGVLMAGGGMIEETDGSLISILAVTLLFTLAGIFARSSLLAVLATLMLSISAATAYSRVFEQPVITVILFGLFSIGLYQLSKKLSPEYERIALAASSAGMLVVNIGFWLGSLWGDVSETGEIILSDSAYAVLWAGALIATAIWSWKQNRRWVLNAVAIFGGIHFFTQSFMHLDTSPSSVLIAGLITIGFTLGIKRINNGIKNRHRMS